MKIVADKNIPFLKEVGDCFGEITYLAGSDFTHQSISDADALIVRTVTHFDEQLLANTSVKLICSATIGYDHIDTHYCDANNIAWCNAPGCNSGSVQQYVAASLITIARQKGFSLRGKTIGVVGVGNVGTKVARICQLLGMQVLLNDPIREKNEPDMPFVSLHTIQQQADIITFHTPLTKSGEYKTYHLGDRDFFASLSRKPIIINSARGAIIDTQAIIEALDANTISAAIIDCWENEPTIDLRYLAKVNLATPHIAGYSADGKANATRMSLTSIANFFGLSKAPISQIAEPEPIDALIDLNTYQSTDRIGDAIFHTYNPSTDCDRLRAAPDSFKQLRNEYPLRREFHAYTVCNAATHEQEVLTQLGFRCV